MERKSNIFWGVILIVLGFLFLGTNLDWFELNWSFRKIAQFWPIMLILAGVAAFFNQKKSIYNATSALLIAFAIPLGIFTCVDDGVKEIKDEISDGINIDIDDDDDNYSSNSDTTTGDRNKQYFAVEMSPEVKEATLKLGGGAAEFDLEESPNRLFEATTLLSFKTGYTLEEETIAGSKVINFSMKDKKGKDFNFGDDNKIDNDVLLKLSTAPVWNIDMGIGAGELDFDFTNYKVKKLDIETGAASIDIKLGDKQDKVDVDIESGVASVKIKVPESVGCEIKMDGALNAKDFDNFEKIKDGLWQTKGFDKATKKIYLNVNSGLSSLKVDRY
ncbi:MAG: LiaI-LiaF-like domain-containing protein [Emticicia sp.]